MRHLGVLLLVALTLSAVRTPVSAGRHPALTVLLAATVSEAARHTMPQATWQRVVADYLNVAKVVPSPATGAPGLAECRAAGAIYAVGANFDVVPRLPGTAQDNDRKYALARFDVLNCITGIAAQPLLVRLESDPIAQTSAGDYEPSPDVTWVRAVRERLARVPLTLQNVARVVRVDAPFVYVDGLDPGMQPNRKLRDFADKDARPRAALEFIVSDAGGRWLQAVFDTSSSPPPRVGDYVEVVPESGTEPPTARQR